DARRGGAEQGPYLVEELVHVFAPLLKRFGGLRRFVRWLPSSLLRRAGRSFAAPQSSQRAAPATSLRPAGSAHRPPGGIVNSCGSLVCVITRRPPAPCQDARASPPCRTARRRVRVRPGVAR